MALNEWLLGATIGNQEQWTIDLQRSETSLHPKWVKHLKIYLKLQIPCYIH